MNAVVFTAATKPPCVVCGVPYAEHGTYPTCATHNYAAAAAFTMREAEALLALRRPEQGWTLNLLLAAVEKATRVLEAPSTDGRGGIL